jgi:hypothetical protein
MAGGIETRSNLPRALWPGVKTWFGQDYNDHPQFVDKMFDIRSSDMAFEEDVELTGFGLIATKNEGGPISYDAMKQGYTSRYTHVSYALGFIVTREEFDDNVYRKVGAQRSRALSRSFRVSREIIGANVLNNGFTASGNADGVALFSTAHPTPAGTQSNRLATDADFSESAVEDMVKLMAQAKDSSGLPIAITPRRIIAGTDYMFEVERLMKSVSRVGTADNDINALRSMGLFTGEPIINPYLTDSDAWFVTTDAQDGLIGYNRTPLEIRRDNDFDTLNLKVAGFTRYSFGYTDWRGVYGTPGG